MRARLFAFVVVVAAAGCAAQGLPVENGGSGSGGSAGSAGGGSGGSTGTLGPDMTKPLGGMGAMCSSACDCMPGLACTGGTCGTSQFGQIYCCESTDCPMGSFCQSSSGGFDQCGNNTGGNGGFGGGGFGGGGGGGFFGDMMSMPVDAGACGAIMCQSSMDCINAGCTTCSRRGVCR